MKLERSALNSIVPLDRTHNRAAFCCGVKHLNNYLKDAAVQDQENKFSRVFVLTLVEDPKFILGYYALSSCQIETKNLPADLLKKLPKRSTVGATLLGKMAIAESVQRNDLKLGRYLLVDAFRQAWIASQSVSSYAMVADIRPGEKGDPSEFYEKHGFLTLTTERKRLFLPMTTIETFLKASEII